MPQGSSSLDYFSPTGKDPGGGRKWDGKSLRTNCLNRFTKTAWILKHPSPTTVLSWNCFCCRRCIAGARERIFRGYTRSESPEWLHSLRPTPARMDRLPSGGTLMTDEPCPSADKA